MVNEKDTQYKLDSYVKKYLKVGYSYRAGYQNSTCEEEHFKNPLRGVPMHSAFSIL